MAQSVRLKPEDTRPADHRSTRYYLRKVAEVDMAVRLGLIGAGAMGSLHAEYLMEGKVARCELVAVCDAQEARLASYSGLEKFTDSRELIRSGVVDAVLIATPHYFHTTTGIDALENGLHVLVEKPLSVHKADCERLLAAHENKSQVFGLMLNYRTFPRFRKIKQIIDDGELGEITRFNWIVTNWFRTEVYYSSGAWRGTWKGEGGGVLMNQCPHQLDLLQWMLGMPSSVRAFCKLGAKHDIEVEDEVTAYMEFPNGAAGVFVTSTGEAPGTNRLEICGDLGKLVLEGRELTITRNAQSSREFSKTDTIGFAMPDTTDSTTTVEATTGNHPEVVQNFTDAILDGAPLIAPAADGLNSVELANAMLYSTLTNSTIELPLDSAAYEAALKNLIANSRFQKSAEEKVLEVTRSLKR